MAIKDMEVGVANRSRLPSGPGNVVRAPVVRVGLLAATLITCVSVLAVAELPRPVIGFLTVGLVLLLLLSGLHIGLSMLLGSVVGLWKLGGYTILEASMEGAVYTQMASWTFSVIPTFILMGIALWRSGLTAKAFETAREWLGRIPGGLAVATNFAGAGLASASGSTVAITYALGRMAVPEMMRSRYRPSLATGTVAMAGTLGQLIPPSVMLVLYAGIAQTAVGPQLIAGIVPGLIIALGYGALIIGRASVSPSLAPKAEQPGVTWGSRLRSLTGIAPVVVIVTVIIGGLFIGVFTPTEAGSVGALAAIIVGWISMDKGEQKLRTFGRFLKQTFLDTVAASAALFLLIVAVQFLTRVLTLSRAAQQLAEWVSSIGLERIGLLLVLVVVYLILGMFLDPLAIMLLTVPILTIPLTQVGVDMLWYGIFVVVLAEIAVVSPPIGLSVFILHRLVQDREINLGVDIKLGDVFRGVAPFIAVSLTVLIVFIFFPGIVSWLPSLSSAG